MTEPDIPLLTDIVEDVDAKPAATPEGSGSPAPIVVFEADDAAIGSTNKHYMPDSRAWEQDSSETVESVEIKDFENVVAELQTRIASHTYELTDEILRTAFSDIEAKIFRQISTRLREQLPELIDSVVREHLLERDESSED